LNETPTIRYPEWKQLYDSILPLIAAGQKTFGYDVLESLAGLDIRSDRGRLQFYRFRREMLKEHSIWFENISGFGYTVVPPEDQPKAAFKRVGHARRKVAMAKAINGLVRTESLTTDQRAFQASTAAVLHELSRAFYSAGKRFRIAANRAATLAAGEPQQLFESISGKQKPEK
jgi:hypothetical protein